MSYQLRPYQDVGSKWLSARTGGILGDEQGLGKTIQAIAALAPGTPVIVVCPAVAKGVWIKHFAWRTDFTTMRMNGRANWAWPEPGQVLVCNYDILPPWLEDGEWPTVPPEGLTVILDEAHYAKNPAATRTKRSSALCRAARAANGRAWGLTGTPIKNRPPDLWCMLGVLGLQEGTWRSRSRFQEAMGGEDWSTWDPSAVKKDTPDVLRRVLLRRNLEDVVLDLPGRNYEDVEVELSEEDQARITAEVVAYMRVAGVDLDTATFEDVLRSRAGGGGAHLMQARKLLATAKVPALLDLLDSWEEQNPNDPPLVWSAHKDPLIALSKRLGWDCMTGDDSAKARSVMVEKFEAGKLHGLALSIGACGTAITLTRARQVYFLDKGWSPTDNDQAASRNYRIGQKRPVLYTSLVADHWLDKRVQHLLEEKEAMIRATVKAAAVSAEGAMFSEPTVVATVTTSDGACRRGRVEQVLNRAGPLDKRVLQSLLAFAVWDARQEKLAENMIARYS